MFKVAGFLLSMAYYLALTSVFLPLQARLSSNQGCCEGALVEMAG